MQRLETKLDGPVLIAPKVFPDDRGFFFSSFLLSTLGRRRVK